MRFNLSSNKKLTGFTLIELIVVLLIGSILLAWGVPNYRDFKIRKEVSLTANEIVYSFNLARAEAIRFGSDVRVSLTGAEWKEGWEVWLLDANGSNSRLIHDQQALTDIAISQFGGTAGQVRFDRLGALVGAAVRFETDNENPVTESQRNIMILPSGSVRVVKP